jgi:hypothetical protein
VGTEEVGSMALGWTVMSISEIAVLKNHKAELLEMGLDYGKSFERSGGK